MATANMALARISVRPKGAIFLLTILTGSFLLFLVQPMIARMALPRLGGAPAVWNSAMLVYQALLLGGYTYAHCLGRLPSRSQAVIHLGLLAVAALWLPIGLVPADPPVDANPVFWVPWLLTTSIGPLFFCVAAQAPLMQRWFSVASGGRDPYALYAASNLGSFGGLLAYPLIVEPNFTLSGQSRLWTLGYALLGVLVLGCAATLPKTSVVPRSLHASRQTSSPDWKRWLHWIALGAVPSGLMLSTTTHITTDIVAMPMLWLIPLGLYLLSFSVAFATGRRLADGITHIAPLAILLLGGTTLLGADLFDVGIGAGLSLTFLFVVAVALHTQMYRLRPEANWLTGFYLAMSVGGVVGGLFAALIAPLLFDWAYEHPLLIIAAAILAPEGFFIRRLGSIWNDKRIGRIVVLLVIFIASLVFLAFASANIPVALGTQQIIAITLLGGLGLLVTGRRIPFVFIVIAMLLVSGGLHALLISKAGDLRSRSYYGIYTIGTAARGQVRTIAHGTTIHGAQIQRAGEETKPTAYYVSGSGIGRVLTMAHRFGGDRTRIGVVGLGVGTLACYARPGQSWRFYEIDPEIARIARDTGKFSFLSRCLSDVPVEIGDARITLSRAPAESLDILVLDAFSSDVVPVHLLTLEALSAYQRALSRNGLLMIHISNRYMDLEPILSVAATAKGWHARVFDCSASADERERDSASSSKWIALTADPQNISVLVGDDEKWRPLRSAKVDPWTDDFSSILPLLMM